MLRRESDCISQDPSFIESYKCAKAPMHILRFIGLIPTRNGVDLCAAVQCLTRRATEPASKSNTLEFLDTGSDDIQISVLIDVREFDGSEVLRSSGELKSCGFEAGDHLREGYKKRFC